MEPSEPWISLRRSSPPFGGPRKLAVRDTAARHFHREQRVVLAFRPLAVYQRAEPRHHFHDAVFLAEEVAGGLDAMRREVVHRASAGLFDVPEVLAMRSAVRLARAHPDHAADPAALDRLPRFDDARARRPRSPHIRASRPDLSAAASICFASARLRASGFVHTWLRFAFGQRERDRQVRLVRQSDDEQVDVVARDGAVELGGRFGDAPVLRKSPGAGRGSRVVQHDLLAVDVLQSLHVEVGHEAGAEHRNRDVFHSSFASVEALWSSAASSQPTSAAESPKRVRPASRTAESGTLCSGV